MVYIATAAANGTLHVASMEALTGYDSVWLQYGCKESGYTGQTRQLSCTPSSIACPTPLLFSVGCISYAQLFFITRLEYTLDDYRRDRRSVCICKGPTSCKSLFPVFTRGMVAITLSRDCCNRSNTVCVPPCASIPCQRAR